MTFGLLSKLDWRVHEILKPEHVNNLLQKNHITVVLNKLLHGPTLIGANKQKHYTMQQQQQEQQQEQQKQKNYATWLHRWVMKCMRPRWQVKLWQ